MENELDNSFRIRTQPVDPLHDAWKKRTVSWGTCSAFSAFHSADRSNADLKSMNATTVRIPHLIFFFHQLADGEELITSATMRPKSSFLFTARLFTIFLQSHLNDFHKDFADD